MAEDIKKKLCEFYIRLKHSFENYRVTLFTIIVITIFEAAVVLWHDVYDAEEMIFRFLLIFGIEALFIESFFVKSIKSRLVAFPAAAVIAGITAFNISYSTNGLQSTAFVYLGKNEQIMQVMQAYGELIKTVTERLLGGYLLLLLIGIVCYSFKNAGVSFEEYALKVFANLMKTLLIYIILLIGSIIIFGVFDVLFIDGYSSLGEVCIVFVTGLYFMPACISSLNNMEGEPGPFLKSLVKYIFSVMIICAMAIVYIYMLKIIIMHEIPSNEIFSIVSMLFCTGMPVWLVSVYYRDETKYSQFIYVLPYIFSPLILLQVYSIGIRIYEYGMTPDRYMAVMLIVFEIGSIFIWKLCRQKYEVMLHLMAVLVVITVFVPVINMESVSNMWQSSFLKKYYREVEDGKEISDLEYKRIVGAYDYLRDKPQTRALAEEYDVSEADFAKLLNGQKAVTEKLTDYDSYTIHCCQMVGNLELDGYKGLSMLNQDEGYNISYSDERYDSRDSIDFSQFKFIVRETGDELVVDISEFAQRCMDYKDEHPDAGKDEMSSKMREDNRIELEDGSVLLINHFEVRYYEGIKDGEDYFKWTNINLGGMLLRK